VVAGQPFTVGIWLKLDPGWHTYWQYSGQSGSAPQVNWTLPRGFSAGPIAWPLPKMHFDDDFLTYVYEDEVLLLVEITPPAELAPGEVSLGAKLNWLVCEKFCVPGSADVTLKLSTGKQSAPANDELFARWRALLPKATPPPAVTWDLSDPKQISLSVEGLAADHAPEFFPIPPDGATPLHPKTGQPGPSGARTIILPLETPPHAGAAATWRGLLVVQKGSSREGWYIASNAGPGTAVPAPLSAAIQGSTPGSAPSALEKPTMNLQKAPTLWTALALAFMGGLVLNIMPCVLPVIALKIFGFVKQAGQEPQRIFRLGLSFVAGVFAFFFLLATIAVVLHSTGRSLSWGAQFQNPYLLAGLIALIFVFGLNLLGVFEITLAGAATSTLSDLSSREGYGGAFLHGLFTTLLGTSCTAPFLAVSVGYALTQPAPIVYLLFLTLALGMSLPYFLLTAVPGWMKFIPKPGVWMERFKQLTGFVMLAVVVWLFSVLAGSRPGAATHLSWYLLALGFACWAMGAYHHAVVRWLLFPLVVVGGYFVILHAPLTAPLETKGSNLDQRMADALQTGLPVFVDFTADWCVNCKAFEKAVISTEKVQAAFKAKKVVTVIADWTNPDPEIEKWLAKFGRAGVPLYLLYRPGEVEPVVMDSLTTGGLLAELAKIGPPN
jgi:thiol:disulfide interchange protein DsbD